MKEIANTAEAVIGAIFTVVAVGLGVFLREFARFAEELYPWGKDGENLEGDDEK